MQLQIGPWDRADEGSGSHAIQAVDDDWDLSRAALDDVEGFDPWLPRTERDILPPPPSPASGKLESRLKA